MKDFVIRLLGRGYKEVEWIKRNKSILGLIFTCVGLYVWNFSCPGLDGIVCSKFGVMLTNLGSFLIGAGVLPSDYREKIVQGIVIKLDDPPPLDRN